MLRHRDVFVFLLFSAACAQVLSYSTYVPNPNSAAPGALIAANTGGEVCAVFDDPSLAGAKFKSDGSVAYTILLIAITSQFAGATQVRLTQTVTATLQDLDRSRPLLGHSRRNLHLDGRGNCGSNVQSTSLTLTVQ